MAHVQSQSTLAAGNGVDSITVTINSVTAGSGLALLTTSYTAPGPWTPSSTGDTWTLDTGGQTTGADTNGYLFINRAQNVGSGTHTITVNPVGPSNYIQSLCCEISGTPTSGTSDGTPASTAGNSTSPATPNITIAANTMLLGVMTHIDVASHTITETYTLLAEEESTAVCIFAAQSRGDSAVSSLTAGTYNLTWTLGGSATGWASSVAGWANSGGGAATKGPPSTAVRRRYRTFRRSF